MPNLNSFFVLIFSLLIISGVVSAAEKAAKNGTTTAAADNSTSTAPGKADGPALISLHPSPPPFRDSQLSFLPPPPPPPPRYNRRPPPHHPHPSHNPHQYHYHHPHPHPYHNPHYEDPYHHHYHHHHTNPFYRTPPPLLPALDPAQFGDLVSGFGQAFTNFLSQRVRAASAPAGQVRLLNGDHNLLATASQLLPAAANRLLGGLQQLQKPGFNIQSRSTQFSPRLKNLSPKPSSGNETSSSSSSSSPETAASSDHQTMVSSPEISPQPPINYDEEGRRLREDIIAKVGHLQDVLTTALEVSKERRDILTRRLLEQTNYRLEQAKARVDRILSEPQNAQMVLRALQTVNQGVGGITAFLQALLERINLRMSEPPPTSTETSLEGSSNGTSTTTTSKPE